MAQSKTGPLQSLAVGAAACELTSGARASPAGNGGHSMDVLEITLDVINRAQQFAQGLSRQEDAVRDARARVVGLRGGLLDQAGAAVRAARAVLLARVRLREAEKAINMAGSHGAEQLPEKQAIKKERNAARISAARLTLRVEILKRSRDEGECEELRTRSARLRVSVWRLAGKLASLEQQHQSLLAASAAASSAVDSLPGRGESKSPRPRDRDRSLGKRLELEARWAQVSASLDSLGNAQLKAPRKTVILVNQCEKSTMLQDLQKRCDSNYQLRLNVEEICSLFKLGAE